MWSLTMPAITRSRAGITYKEGASEVSSLLVYIYIHSIFFIIAFLDVTDDSGHHSAEVQLLQHLTAEERRSILNTAAAADIEDLEQFGRYEIMLYKLSL